MKTHLSLSALAVLASASLTSASFASRAFAQETAPVATPTVAPTATASVENAETEDETVIVVSDTKTPKPLADSASSVSVISGERIELREARNITEVLREVPGLSFSQSGTLGKTTSIFTRGTNSNHTLVLIDGIRANAGTDGRFDFGQFPPENIERIEILRGPGSALYGSDAIGGVINIITKRGTGPLRSGGQLEFGSRSDNRQTVQLNGQSGKNRISLSAFRLDSEGQFQNDDYQNNGLSLRLDRELGQNQELTFTTRFSRAKFGVPGQQPFNPDPTRRDKTQDLGASLQFTNRAANRRDLIRLGLFDRQLTDDATRSGQFPALTPSQIDEQTAMLEAQTSFELGKNLLTFGVESRREKADNFSANAGFSFTDSSGQAVVVPPSTSIYNRSRRTNAVFVQNEFRSGKLTLVPGARYEDNSQFGSADSYRLAGAYDISEQTKLRASYGTAFKAPTFSLLYFPGFSNPNLQPERSKGGEIGVTQNWKSGSLSASIFRNEIRDLIQFSPTTFVPENLARAKTRGVELAFEQNLGDGFQLVGAQTFLSARSGNDRLLRRPRFTSSLNLLHRKGKWTTDLGFLAQGKRQDSNFVNEFSARTYPGFRVFNLTLGYAIRPGIEIYGRAGNLLGSRYEEVAGFPAPRFNLAFGVRTAAF